MSKRPCELCQSKVSTYGYRVGPTFWRICLSCVAEFRSRGENVRPAERIQERAA